MIGARQSLTPKPSITMKGNHGMWVNPYKLISPAAVAVKIGVAQDHKNGTANT
jgi:hypothetical protein